MPRNDARQFKKDLTRFADKVELDLSQFRKRVTLGLKSKIELRTPVDTGRLRSSWAVSDGVPSDWVPPEGQTNQLGPIEAKFDAPYDTSFIACRLPYAIAIEYGHSEQSPAGMVRVSMAEMQTELESAFGEF